MGNFNGEFITGNLSQEIDKMTHCFLAPGATNHMRTAKLVLDNAQTRCLTSCDGLIPADSGGHFWAGWQAELGNT
jgi:hypothetical protein